MFLRKAGKHDIYMYLNTHDIAILREKMGHENVFSLTAVFQLNKRLIKTTINFIMDENDNMIISKDMNCYNFIYHRDDANYFNSIFDNFINENNDIMKTFEFNSISFNGESYYFTLLPEVKIHAHTE